MPMNRVQFQSGLSMPDFLQQSGTEIQCAAAVEEARWPVGFSCPLCGHATHTVLNAGSGSRKTFQCQACRHQTSLIAGTLFQGTHLPLTLWFLAIYKPRELPDFLWINTMPLQSQDQPLRGLPCF